MLELSTIAVLGLGFVLGLKHATDADHIVAVTTFVGEQNTIYRSLCVGVFWGIGHTIALTVAGLMIVFLGFRISESLATRLELAVAAMLVFLGVRAVFRWGQKLEVHKHTHNRPLSAMGLKALAVGVVHGAAGSAALMLLVVSALSERWTAILYILIFGLGSILGMALVSLLLAAPFHWIRGWSAGVVNHIQLMAGLSSCCFGLYLAFTLL